MDFSTAPQGDTPDGDLIFMVKGAQAEADAVVTLAGAMLGSLAPTLQSAASIHATLILASSPTSPRAVTVARQLAPFVRSAAFDLTFDRLEWFASRPSAPDGIAAFSTSQPPPEWRALRDQLSQIPRRLGQPLNGGLRPHLTLAYRCSPFEPRGLANPIVWRISGFQLVHSRPGRGHVELDRWDLG